MLDLKSSLEKEEISKRREAEKKIPTGLLSVMKHIDQAVTLGAERAFADKLISKIVDGDFAVFETKAFKDMNDHETRDVAMICESRLGALGWLCGNNPWDFKQGELEFINPLGSLWSPDDLEEIK